MPELEPGSPPPAAARREPAAGAGRPRIVGFLCDFSVDAAGLVAPDGTLRDLPNVTLINVPCSGFIRPSWLEFALRNGAEGTFVCGCPLGDCFNRFGNNLIGDRVTQLRRRFERQKIHPDRIAAIYFGLHDHAGFLAAVRAFSNRVAQLPGPVVPAPRAAAQRPAARPGAPETPGAPSGVPSSAPSGAPSGVGQAGQPGQTGPAGQAQEES